MLRRVLGLLDMGSGSDADLVSSLLFDGAFTSRLIDLGRADASARRDELLAFFGEVDEEEPEEPQSAPGSGRWSIPPPIVG